MLVAHRPDARAGGDPSYHFLTTGAPERVRADRPALPRARRWWPPVPVRRAGSGDEAHRRRLLGLLSRARTRRPAATCSRPTTTTGRHLADPARPRQRRARRAAPVRRPAGRSTRCCSATCTPTTASTCAASTCCASTTRRARSRGSRSGARTAPPSGWPAPTTCRPSPGMTRGVRLPRPTTGRSRSARSRSSPSRSSTRSPAYGLRVTADGATRRLHRRHRPVRRRSTRWPRASTCCWPRRRSAHGDDNPPELHLTGARRAARPPTRAGVRPAGAHPRAAVARPGGRAGARRRTTYDGPIELAARRRASSSERRPAVRPARRRGRRSRSAPGW